MNITLVLLANVLFCVGFTGPKCDESYPMTEDGFQQAIVYLTETGGTVMLARGMIIATRTLALSCDVWIGDYECRPQIELPVPDGLRPAEPPAKEK